MTLIELTISAIVLVTIMSFITSICLQVSLVWKDIGHHRAAINELSNQLEHLTRLSLADAKQALGSLEPSEACSRTLNSPKLNGELMVDNLGVRVVLQVDWKRRYPGKPIELVGWMPPELLEKEGDSSSKNASSEDELAEQHRQTETFQTGRKVSR